MEGEIVKITSKTNSPVAPEQSFKVIPEIIITSDPIFWVIIGVFSFSIISGPVFIVTGFFYKIVPENKVFILIGLLPSLGFITLHFFLIKAILCTKKLQ